MKAISLAFQYFPEFQTIGFGSTQIRIFKAMVKRKKMRGETLQCASNKPNPG